MSSEQRVRKESHPWGRARLGSGQSRGYPASMRALPLVCAILTATVLALAACGGESDEEQIERVVASFADAVEEKDVGKFCGAVITDEIPGGGKCEDGLSAEDIAATGDVESVMVSDIEIDGDTATADVTTKVDGEDMKEDLDFRKRDGDWKIDFGE